MNLQALRRAVYMALQAEQKSKQQAEQRAKDQAKERALAAKKAAKTVCFKFPVVTSTYVFHPEHTVYEDFCQTVPLSYFEVPDTKESKEEKPKRKRKRKRSGVELENFNPLWFRKRSRTPATKMSCGTMRGKDNWQACSVLI